MLSRFQTGSEGEEEKCSFYSISRALTSKKRDARKLSIKREDRVVVVFREREQLIRQDGIPKLHVFGFSFSCVDASKAAPSPPLPSPLRVGISEDLSYSLYNIGCSLNL